MSIPQNFDVVEQQVLAVTSTSANVHFTAATPAGKSTVDLMVFNGGTKAAQVITGAASATAAVADASASGTKQFKVGAGAYVVVRKNADTYVAGICEGSDTTTLYCHSGLGV